MLEPFQNFCGGSYYRSSYYLNSERSLNWYPEIAGPGESNRAQMALASTPGTSLYCAIPELGQVFALITTTQVVEGIAAIPRTFAIVGAVGALCKLYELTGPGTFINRGTCGGTPIGSFGWKMAASPTQLVMVNGSPNGALFNLVTNTLTLLTAATSGWLGGCDVGFLDGYFVVIEQYSQKFYISAYQDGSVWPALDYAIESDQPDAIVGLGVDHRQLWIFGKKRCEVWYDSGAANFPFSRNNSASIEYGTLSNNTICTGANTLFFLGRNELGGVQAFRMEGYNPRRISTSALESIWQAYVQSEDPVIWAYQSEGHDFLYVRFTDAQSTWVWDNTTSFWHERTSGHRCHTFTPKLPGFTRGAHLVGDPVNANIYQMDRSIGTENGSSILRVRTAPHAYSGGVRQFYKRMVLDVQTGSGGVPASLSMQYSDDGGNNFTAPVAPQISSSAYSARAEWNRLGSALDRVYTTFLQESTAPWTIAGAYLDVQAGTR